MKAETIYHQLFRLKDLIINISIDQPHKSADQTKKIKYMQKYEIIVLKIKSKLLAIFKNHNKISATLKGVHNIVEITQP